MNLSRLFSQYSFAPFAVQLVFAYEWLSAGWEKISTGKFIPNIGRILLGFENGNPHAWYVGSVLGVAKNHPEIFGMLIQWGELLTGLGLIMAVVLYACRMQPFCKKAARCIAVVALLGGAFMNLNFYFAAGWTSPSTGGLNVLMFWTEFVLLIVWVHGIWKNDRGESAVLR